MVQGRAACLFCFSTGNLPKLSREHLLSRPVAKAFGIDRTASFLRFDPDNGDHQVGTIDGLGQRVVCEPCNNGWMNRLEDAMANLAPWLANGDEALGEVRTLGVRSWALKTHLILCYLAGNARNVGENEQEYAVLPNFTLARQLYESDVEAISGLAVGLARVRGNGSFGYAFGNPTVVPVGPNYTARTAAVASIITVGGLQVWIATSLRPADVRAPAVAVSPELLARDLPTRVVLGDLDAIVVDHGDHDLATELAALTAWAAEETRRSQQR
jgi:hypothetical protein